MTTAHDLPRRLLGLGLALAAALLLARLAYSGIQSDGLLPLTGGALAAAALATLAGAAGFTRSPAWVAPALLAATIVVGLLALGSIPLASPVAALWVPAALLAAVCLTRPRAAPA